MIDEAKLCEEYKKSRSISKTAKALDLRQNTARSYLRKAGLIRKRKESQKQKKIIEGHSLKLSQRKTAKYLGVPTHLVSLIWMEEGLDPHYEPGKQPLEDSVLEERTRFLEQTVGLNLKSIIGKYSCHEHLWDTNIMKESYSFFLELGADTKKTYETNPNLLGIKRRFLDSKLEFLVDGIGVKKKKLAKSTRIFTFAVDLMKSRYEHYIKKFGNKEQSMAMIRSSHNLLCNDTNTIDDKIGKFEEESINFHMNYSLLEKDPEKVIDTRNYLDKLEIYEPEKKWYYMLLAVDRETIKPKVEYCEKEGIKWREYPRVLILGLGTEEKPGALPRRVNMIKKACGEDYSLPEKLDYKNNPAILSDFKDQKLKGRIKRYGYKRTG